MNTFSDIYLQLVFSVKYRDAQMDKYWKNDLYAYMASILNTNGHHTIIVNGTADHVHILIRYNITQSIPELVKELKTGSSKWINVSRKTLCRFAWQKGYGVFSYTRGHVDNVKRYIQNQESHHATISHVDEMADILTNRGIAFDAAYLPHLPE